MGISTHFGQFGGSSTLFLWPKGRCVAAHETSQPNCGTIAVARQLVHGLRGHVQAPESAQVQQERQ